MVRQDGAFLRTQRIGEILRVIKRNQPVKKGELISYIEATIGLTRKRVEEYLNLLVASKQASYDEASDTYSEVKAHE